MQEKGKTQKTTKSSSSQLSNYFPVTVDQQTDQALLTVFFPEQIVSTHKIKNVTHFFQQHLPELLETTCFNAEDLPFRLEIVRTELAHLFEHIILVLLCQAEKERGVEDSLFSGETSWDWSTTPKGLFTIILSVTKEKTELLDEVLPKASHLIDAFFAANGISPNQNQSRQAYLPIPGASNLLHN